MRTLLPPPTPRVGIHVRGTLQPATPVKLGGQKAYLLTEPAPRIAESTRVRLDWADGRVTQLDARVRNVDTPSRVTTVEICAVDGDWQPFLEYLALGVD